MSEEPTAIFEQGHSGSRRDAAPGPPYAPGSCGARSPGGPRGGPPRWAFGLLFGFGLLAAALAGAWLARSFLSPAPPPAVPAEANEAALAASLARPAPSFARGINLEPIGDRDSTLDLQALPAALEELRLLGIDRVALIPSFFQRRLEDTEFFWRGSRARVAADTRAAIRVAHAHGFGVLLKPHLWLYEREGGAWRGEIHPAGPAWVAWRAAYRDAVLEYARMAAEEDVEALSIGSELRAVALAYPEFWRRLAAEVRALYPGEITYAANWQGEFEAIAWWQAVDAIGVDAFWPLTGSPGETLTLAGCLERMAVVRERLAAVAARAGRPVLLTEIGYKSAEGGAYRPWQWAGGGRADPRLQRVAYECVARTFAPLATVDSWLQGAYFWIWYVDPRWGGPDNADFTPRGKPAAAVLRAWFAGEGASP